MGNYESAASNFPQAGLMDNWANRVRVFGTKIGYNHSEVRWAKSMNPFRLLIAVLFLVQIGPAQNPTGVSLTLTTKSGRGSFRMGAAIILRLALPLIAFRRLYVMA
jgi:hypothetical protein